VEHKQTIVLRRDLNMRKGKMIAQGAHASMRAIHARQLKRVVDNCTTHRRMLEAAKKSADSE
jgi:peptidyl-tRNA hydrolase